MNVITAHRYAVQNRDDILASELCGCFYCCKTFLPTKIVSWIDKKQTAKCPECGIDSVLGSNSCPVSDEKFLKDMYNHWFNPRKGKNV